MRRKPTLDAIAMWSLLGQGLLFALTPAAWAQENSGVTWEAQASPFQLNFRQSDRLLTSQRIGAAGAGSRLSYRLNDGTSHSLTNLISTETIPNGTAYSVATDEPTRTARVAVTQTPRGARVEWTFSRSNDIAQVFEALSASLSEHFLGTGARAQYVDLQRKVTPLKVHFVDAPLAGDCNETHLPMPFFFSNAGYGIYLDTPNIGRIAFPGATPKSDPVLCKPDADPAQLISANDRTQIAIKAQQLAYEVYAGSPESILTSFTAIAGRMKLPPIEQFALYKWRDQVAGAAEVLDDITQMKRRNLPIGSVILDNPWEQKLKRPLLPLNQVCNGTFLFDPTGFPDPKGLIDAVHAQGVRFVLWVSPFVFPLFNVPQCPTLNYGARNLINPKTQYSGTLGKRDVDLTGATAVQIYKNKLRPIFQLGVDGVKGDRGDESDFEPLQLRGGPGVALHNPYPYLFAKATTEVLQETRGDNWTTIFRSGFTPSPTVLNGIWAGDQLAFFSGLQQAIRKGLTSSVSGYPIWGSDVGGYLGSPLTPTSELFIRWMQLGAISPILEVGGTGRQAKFWNYGDTVVEQFRKFATLHYELFPYHYQLTTQSVATGVPILRPLGFQYPQDETAWQKELEVMVGPHMLAAPITIPSPNLI